MKFLLFLLTIQFATIFDKVNGYYPRFTSEKTQEWLKAQNFNHIKVSKRISTRYTHHQPLSHRVLETSIIFPADDSFPIFSNSNGNNDSKISIREGSVCFLSDGNTGVCKGIKSCEAFGPESSTFRPTSIKWCAEDDAKSWLICCPKSNKEEEVRLQTTPKAELKDTVEVPKVPSASELSITPQPVAEKASISSPSPTTSTSIQQQPSSSPEPITSPDENDPELQNTCGVLPGNSQKLEQYGTNWPWIVSIGRRNADGDIDWICLGSLITKDYVLTIATCLQKLPNVILFGNQPYIGRMKAEVAQNSQYSNDIRTVGQVISHEKFKSPHLYRNIGLLQIVIPIHVTSTRMPICFPFLAGVLDIMDFKGKQGVTLGFNFPVKIENIGLEFQRISYKVLNNTECNKLYNLQRAKTSYRLPNGIRPDNMCGFYKLQTSICQAPGSPLVIWDPASNSFVIIGISSGDPTCSEFKRQLVTFTRINAFSSWVRERIGEFPQPPPCYI